MSAASENTQASSHVAQIQELVDLVHQWRTMNESPEVHKRLASAQEAEEQGQTIEAIRGKNEDFDQVTRRAMAELSEGRSAEEQIASARSLLAELMKLVESLPEG